MKRYAFQIIICKYCSSRVLVVQIYITQYSMELLHLIYIIILHNFTRSGTEGRFNFTYTSIMKLGCKTRENSRILFQYDSEPEWLVTSENCLFLFLYYLITTNVHLTLIWVGCKKDDEVYNPSQALKLTCCFFNRRVERVFLIDTKKYIYN